MRVEKNIHVGSYGFIISNNRIVLIKKARGGYKGLLDIPGGGLEHNENPLEALFREINEETGLLVTEHKLIDVVSKTFSWQMEKDVIEDLHHIGILYEIKTTGNLKLEPDGIDSNGANWYEIRDLNKEILTPFVIDGLEKLGYKI